LGDGVFGAGEMVALAWAPERGMATPGRSLRLDVRQAGRDARAGLKTQGGRGRPDSLPGIESGLDTRLWSTLPIGQNHLDGHGRIRSQPSGQQEDDQEATDEMESVGGPTLVKRPHASAER